MTFTTHLACQKVTVGGKDFIRTCRVRLSYPTLFTPKAMAGTDKLKYSVTGLVPANADLTALKEECYAAAAKKFGPKWKEKFPKLPMPFHKTTDENQEGTPHYKKIGINPEEFPFFIRTSTNADDDRDPPGVVTHAGDPASKDQVYAGRWAMLSVQPYGYEQSSKKGVSLGLLGTMLLERGDRLGGGFAAKELFEPVEISESADALFKDDAA